MLLYTERRNVQCFTYNFQNRKFMLFIEDDICFIHAKQHPKSSVTSTTWHMCTAVVDVHDKMEAVDLGDDITKNHSNVQVTMENGSVWPCRGGYWHSAPPWFCICWKWKLLLPNLPSTSPSAIQRVAMDFISFNHRNYNKATPCQLSDLLFHLTNNPDMAHNFQHHLEVFTEKKVEMLHSVFRR